MRTIENIITAGATLDFLTNVPDYPASAGWVLKYRLAPRDGAGAVIDITASAAGEAYAVQVPRSVTLAWGAGYYTAASWVEKGGELYPVGENVQVQILARPDTLAAGVDGRTHAQRVLDAIKAVLERRASMDQQEYTIHGRMLKRMQLDELLKFRRVYEGEVNAEQVSARLAAGLPVGGKVQVRF